uniref:Zgc:112163 n=1 Tax=Poecilia latipinna TaxID=48699 RepID=A0A3B3U5D2_9TELE
IISPPDLFVSAARNSLRSGRKSLSVAQSLNLAAQVLTVDLGLKPALLYDSNAACAEQLQRYLSRLRSLQLVSRSLLTLDLNGNGLIINADALRSNLEKTLCGGGPPVVNVSASLEKPAVSDAQRGRLTGEVADFLLLLEEFRRHDEADKPLYVGEKSDDWNLCTIFGLLLGYPVTYWFDQARSFENCLSMTPLVVATASAAWQTDGNTHRFCLYSFSVPAALQEETRPKLENWRLRLQERFEQQSIMKDLSISQSTVTLPSVCL